MHSIDPACYKSETNGVLVVVGTLLTIVVLLYRGFLMVIGVLAIADALGYLEDDATFPRSSLVRMVFATFGLSLLIPYGILRRPFPFWLFYSFFIGTTLALVCVSTTKFLIQRASSPGSRSPLELFLLVAFLGSNLLLCYIGPNIRGFVHRCYNGDGLAGR